MRGIADENQVRFNIVRSEKDTRLLGGPSDLEPVASLVREAHTERRSPRGRSWYSWMSYI